MPSRALPPTVLRSLKTAPNIRLEPCLTDQLKFKTNSNVWDKTTFTNHFHSLDTARIPFLIHRTILDPMFCFWQHRLPSVCSSALHHLSKSLGACAPAFSHTLVISFLGPDFKPQLSHFISYNPKQVTYTSWALVFPSIKWG